MIRRKQATCLPFPPGILEHLRAVQAGADPAATQPTANPSAEHGGPKAGQSYCVRCFVWRPEPTGAPPCLATPCGWPARPPRCPSACESDADEMQPAHHCGTCGYCVVGFDHQHAARGLEPPPSRPRAARRAPR